MNKLSTDFIFVYKTLLPVAAFGFLTIILLKLAINGSYAICVPILGAGFFFYYFFENGPWKLADEIYDAGDYLVVRKGQIETGISFKQILSIEIESYRPTKIVIVFREPNEIGDKVVFIPQEPMSLDVENRNVVINLLRVKLLDAR